jgi:uncharacterized protein
MTPQTRALLNLAAGDLAAAQRDLAAEDPRHAVTRAYCAAFHAAGAALDSEGLAARSHSGTGTLFNSVFVKSGRLDPSLSRTLSGLMKLRQGADYEVGQIISMEDAEGAVVRSVAFVDAVEALLGEAPR